MYTAEDLKKYNYFDGAELNYVLDSLTGVISRQYILDFARQLVEDKKPFVMCMMDLDNFKYINDSYGHKAGDQCLKTIGDGLIECVGDEGIVGRFGGDEFVILYFKSVDYNDVHAFFERLFAQSGAVRKMIYIENVRIFITATVGCATFPKDADNYNELFMKMDKALYRGKSKGRNCYIIYVHEKHKDIVVNERGTNSLLAKILEIKKLIDDNDTKIIAKRVIDALFMDLHPAKAYYVSNDNMVVSATEPDMKKYDGNASFTLGRFLVEREVYASSNPSEVKEKFPLAESFIVKNRVHAFVVVKVGSSGYILIYENNVTRMWQDYDLVLLHTAATMLGYKLEK